MKRGLSVLLTPPQTIKPFAAGNFIRDDKLTADDDRQWRNRRPIALDERDIRFQDKVAARGGPGKSERIL